MLGTPMGMGMVPELHPDVRGVVVIKADYAYAYVQTSYVHSLRALHH